MPKCNIPSGDGCQNEEVSLLDDDVFSCVHCRTRLHLKCYQMDTGATKWHCGALDCVVEKPVGGDLDDDSSETFTPWLGYAVNDASNERSQQQQEQKAEMDKQAD